MIIDGKKIAEQILGKIDLHGAKLSIVLCSNDLASKKYIEMKKKKGMELGVEMEIIEVENSKSKLIETIDSLNSSNTNGILVQLPLYSELQSNTQEILEKISPIKDVDGLTLSSLKNAFNFSNSAIVPATVKGVITVLEFIANEEKTLLKDLLLSKNIVIINNSNLIGKPLGNILSSFNSTVTLLNKYSKNINEIIKGGDIVISASGQGNLITAEMIKEDIILIDITSQYSSGRIIGDVVVTEELLQKVKYITPVPGGIGPITIATLFDNLRILRDEQSKQ